MFYDAILWDLDDDPNGNVQHCARHNVSKEEVEQVFDNCLSLDVSRSSGMPAIFGETSLGRYLIVIFEEVDEDTVYPITAYDVSRPNLP